MDHLSNLEAKQNKMLNCQSVNYIIRMSRLFDRYLGTEVAVSSLILSPLQTQCSLSWPDYAGRFADKGRVVLFQHLWESTSEC